MRPRAIGFNPSAPRPYTVSVGKATSCPARMIEAASAMVVRSGAAGSIATTRVMNSPIASHTLRPCADKQVVGLDIALTGFLDDIIRQPRSRRLPIPPQTGSIVAHELLIEAWLRTSGLITGTWPIAR